MDAINILMKPSSGLCNMECDYCFYCDETQKREQESYGFMSDETLKNVIRKSVLAADKYCAIAFQGGEPTLIGLEFFEKVIEYVKHYNKRNIQIEYALQTNGYGITKEWCEFFAKNNFLLGLSIDGLEFTHNTYRHNKKGEDTYQRIKETAVLFDEYKIEYNILTVVHSKTAPHIKEI